MINLKEYTRLKQIAEERKSERERAEGALAQAISELKSRFGVESVKEAKKLLAKLERRSERLQGEFHEAIVKVKAIWDKQ